MDQYRFGSCSLDDLQYIQHTAAYSGNFATSYKASFLWQPEPLTDKTVLFYATSAINPQGNAHTANYSFATWLDYKPAVTSANPVYPVGSLGLEALDPPSNEIVATRTLTTNPLYKTAMKRDGSRLYSLTFPATLSNQLLIIDPRNGSIVNTLSVSGSGLALSPDESRLYVVGYLNATTARLSVFDASTFAPVGTVDFGSAGYYFDVAALPSGGRIYISQTNSRIIVIDAPSLSLLPPIALASPFTAMAVSPDSSRLLVTTQDSMLTTYSTASNAVLFQLPIDLTAKGIVFSPDGLRAYVLSQNNSYLVIITTVDVATSTPLALFSFPTDGPNNFFRISADGTRLYGGRSTTGNDPDPNAWSVTPGGTPVVIPSAQNVLDIAMPPPPATMARPAGLRVTEPLEGTYSGSLSSIGPVQFGGGGSCDYTITFNDVHSALRISGNVVDSGGVTLVATETGSWMGGPCPFPTIPTNPHSYSFVSGSRSGLDVSATFQAAGTNAPPADLSFSGRLSSDGRLLTGTFRWHRNDAASPFDWTVNATMTLQR